MRGSRRSDASEGKGRLMLEEEKEEGGEEEQEE